MRGCWFDSLQGGQGRFRPRAVVGDLRMHDRCEPSFRSLKCSVSVPNSRHAGPFTERRLSALLSVIEAAVACARKRSLRWFESACPSVVNVVGKEQERLMTHLRRSAQREGQPTVRHALRARGFDGDLIQGEHYSQQARSAPHSRKPPASQRDI